MKLAPRERNTIVAGALVVAVLIGWKWMGAREAGGAAQSPEALVARLDDQVRLEQGVGALTRELGLKLPTTSLGEQETALREDISRQAQQAGLKLASLRPVAGGRAAGAGAGAFKPLQFRLDLAGQYNDCIKFINMLEQSELPYVVREVSLESAGRRGGGKGKSPEGGGGGGGGGGQPGQVQVTMKVQSYLFPEAPPEKPKPAETPKQEAASQPASQPAGGDGATTATATRDGSTTATAMHDGATSATAARDAATSATADRDAATTSTDAVTSTSAPRSADGASTSATQGVTR